LQAHEDDVDQAAEFKIDLQYDRHPSFGYKLMELFESILPSTSLQTAIAAKFTLALQAIFGHAWPTIKQIDSGFYFKIWLEETCLV
jgi:hypothetical protein